MLERVAFLLDNILVRLCNLFPDFLVNPNFKANVSDTFHIQDADLFIGKERTAKDLETVQTGAHLDITLGHKNFLSRSFQFPKMGNEQLEKAIALKSKSELPRLTDKLCWVNDIKRGKLNTSVEQHIIRESKLSKLVDRITSEGYVVRRIFVEKVAIPIVDNSLSIERPKLNWMLLNLVLIALALSVFGYFQFKKYQTSNNHMSILDEQTNQLREKAILETRLLENLLEQAQLERDTQAEILLGQQRTLTISRLTDFFEDYTWISELSLKNNTLYMSGFSKNDVSEILTLFKQQPWVVDANLESAISSDQNGSKRFEIRAEIQL